MKNRQENFSHEDGPSQNAYPVQPQPTEKHLTGMDIVVIGLQPWYYPIGSNCKNIALQLSKNNRILYVNLPINRKTRWSKNKTAGVLEHCKIIKTKTETIRKVQDNLWEFFPPTILESINWLPSKFAFKAGLSINNKRFCKDLSKAMESLHFQNIILFNDNDIYNGFYLKQFLKPKLYIYYIRDFLQGFNYWKKYAPFFEPDLIRRADLVVANSTYYAAYCKSLNPVSFYIGQGCDLEMFNHRKVLPYPQDLNGIAGPIIGYVGAVDSSRLDLTILASIAKNNPRWNIVIVGPEDAVFLKSNLHDLRNVHFLGRKPLVELPAYVNGFDVCLNPQLKNDVTKGNYPLKIDEYLAMGKPVVATRTKTMEMFEDYTFLAETPDEYTSLIKKALESDNSTLKQARIAFANIHSWENTTNALESHIMDLLDNQN